jgi:hypothetical protein
MKQILADCWLGISNFGLLAMAAIISHESLKLESLFLTQNSSFSCLFLSASVPLWLILSL